MTNTPESNPEQVAARTLTVRLDAQFVHATALCGRLRHLANDAEQAGELVAADTLRDAVRQMQTVARSVAFAKHVTARLIEPKNGKDRSK